MAVVSGHLPHDRRDASTTRQREVVPSGHCGRAVAGGMAPAKKGAYGSAESWRAIFLAAGVMAGAIPGAAGAVSGIIPHSYTKFGIGAEWFSWKSTDPVATETGPRITLSLSADNFQRYERGAVFGLGGTLYGGRMQMEGNPETDDAVTTASDYMGLRLEGLFGYGGNRTNIFAAVGADAWQRSVQEGITASGEIFPGFDEKHLIVYGKLGGTIREYDYYTDLGFPLPFEISAGFKFPLFVSAMQGEDEGRAEASLPVGGTNSVFVQLSKRFWIKYAISIYSEFYQIDDLSESFNDSVIGDAEAVKRLQKDISILGLQLSRRF